MKSRTIARRCSLVIPFPPFGLLVGGVHQPAQVLLFRCVTGANLFGPQLVERTRLCVIPDIGMAAVLRLGALSGHLIKLLRATPPDRLARSTATRHHTSPSIQASW